MKPNPFKIDLGKFKKVSENERSTTLLHPDGHSITLSHEGMSETMKKKLRTLPKHMSGGGESIDYGPLLAEEKANQAPYGTPQAFPMPAQAQTLASSVPVSNQNIPVSLGASPSGSSGNALQGQTPETTQAVPIASSPNQGIAPANLVGQQQDVLAREQDLSDKAIQGHANAERTKAAQDQIAYQNQIDSLNRINQDYQARHMDLMGEVAHVMDDIDQNHINPDQLWENKSGLGKVSSAIGLILGGIGGGLTHQENPALRFLNDEINRNVEAQKANLNKKGTLLNTLLAQHGDLNTATDMARAITTASLAAQIGKAGAQAGTQEASANANDAKLKFLSGIAPLLQQTALRQSLAQVGQGGAGSSQARPEDYVPYLVPQEHQKTVFEEIQRHQNVANNSDKMLQMFDQAANDNTVLKTGAGLVRTPGTVMSLHQLMLPNFKQVDGTVRQAAMDETFKNITPQPGDTAHKVAIKRAALQSWMHSEVAAPTSRAYGLDLDRFGSTASAPEARLSPLQQSYVKWARENPSDQRSQMVLQKLGVN